MPESRGPIAVCEFRSSSPAGATWTWSVSPARPVRADAAARGSPFFRTACKERSHAQERLFALLTDAAIMIAGCGGSAGSGTSRIKVAYFQGAMAVLGFLFDGLLRLLLRAVDPTSR